MSHNGRPIVEFVPERPVHRDVWVYMVENALGAENAISSKTLREIANVRDDESYRTSTREIIGEMQNQGAPIGGNNRGYFVATTVEQLIGYEESLRRRLEHQGKRPDDIRRIIDRIQSRDAHQN